MRESDLERVGGLGLGLGCRQAKYVPIVEARKEKGRVAWGREGSGGSMVGDFMIALWGFGCFGLRGSMILDYEMEYGGRWLVRRAGK